MSLTDYATALASDCGPLTDQQVEAAARILATVQVAAAA